MFKFCPVFDKKFALDESHLRTNVDTLKLRPHLYVNVEWGMGKWEKCWYGRAEALQTAFVCVANIWWTAERYPFGVSTSKKNIFAMLGVHLTRRTPNNHFLAFVRVCLSPACFVRIRVQMWTYLNILYFRFEKFSWTLDFWYFFLTRQIFYTIFPTFSETRFSVFSTWKFLLKK